MLLFFTQSAKHCQQPPLSHSRPEILLPLVLRQFCSGDPGPVSVLASPGTSLEMQIPGLCPRPTESGGLERGPDICLNKLSWQLGCRLQFENYCQNHDLCEFVSPFLPQFHSPSSNTEGHKCSRGAYLLLLKQARWSLAPDHVFVVSTHKTVVVLL